MEIDGLLDVVMKISSSSPVNEAVKVRGEIRE
jgi:hypothetical protein